MPRLKDHAARERILDAADRLLARHGYARMTVGALAVEAGIGKGTVYLWFPSKEDVALGCIDRMAARLLARLRDLSRGADPPERRLRRLLVTRVLHRFDYACEHSASLDALLSAFRPALLERRAAHFEAETRVLEAVLREGVRAGAFAAGPPRGAARALILATNALLPYSLSARELGRRRALAAQVSRVADLLLTGVMRRPVRPAARAHPTRRSPP